MTGIGDCRVRLEAIVAELDRLELAGAACYASMAIDAIDAQLRRAIGDHRPQGKKARP